MFRAGGDAWALAAPSHVAPGAAGAAWKAEELSTAMINGYHTPTRFALTRDMLFRHEAHAEGKGQIGGLLTRLPNPGRKLSYAKAIRLADLIGEGPVSPS